MHKQEKFIPFTMKFDFFQVRYKPHDERNPSSDLIISPLEDLKISTDTGTVYTDSNGLFTMEEDSTIDEECLASGIAYTYIQFRGTEVLLNINTEEKAENTNIQIFDFNSFNRRYR